ncbi:hypothetical protein KQ303_10785 [Synechococcus sp. CS-1333]|uniref:hypothetical protein n=1 Tax=Synechococcus sp. CS-1333 TaxID=2848638 RepID=UPI00223B0315|nr:hypothetical protein [Synechococcus sp. CS-1333]MCT0211153.1 hypothetical protein [Synechococcus sp. CS-1333]
MVTLTKWTLSTTKARKYAPKGVDPSTIGPKWWADNPYRKSRVWASLGQAPESMTAMLAKSKARTEELLRDLDALQQQALDVLQRALDARQEP